MEPAKFFYAMSKGNMLLGHARGKVGSLVFSRSNGQQVVRARAEVVKNPQTTAQMIQRIIMCTVSQAYSKLSAICDHSFEGVAKGQDSMSYFTRVNLNALRTQLAAEGDLDSAVPEFAPIGSNILAVNPYIISKGQLPEINPTNVVGTGADLNIGLNSYAGILEALGLVRGDQITFVIVCGETANSMKMKYARVILDPKESDGTDAPLSTPFFVDNAINKPNPKNENYGIIYSLAGTTLTFATTETVLEAAVIASRKGLDGNWQRSNSVLVSASEGGYGMSMQKCLDAFNEGGIDVENPRFLNNANRPSGGVPVTQGVLVTLTAQQGGTVSGGGRYAIGTEITVTATPDADHNFLGWYEGNTQKSDSQSYTFEVTGAVTLEARFMAE